MTAAEQKIARYEKALGNISSELRYAHNYLASDPASSLTKSRLIMERLLIEIYQTEMHKEPKKPMLGDILADNQFTRKIERRIISRMNAIRDMGNLGPHGEYVKPSDAARVLEDLFEVIEWYVGHYANAASAIIKEQIKGKSNQIQQLGQAVIKLLEQYQVQRRHFRPADSRSLRNDGERQMVKELVSSFRSLPEKDQRQVPALLGALGKLEVMAGDFDSALGNFRMLVSLAPDANGQAEAHFGAYQAALERRDWTLAFTELVNAVKLDAKRFAPFPVGKYQPQRILGAGGFGVAFLAKHKYMEAAVVVKTLFADDLERDTEKVFAEAHALRQLDHPAIIRVSDCGFVDAAAKARPFLVMDYFAGLTLEEHVRKNGPLSCLDLVALALKAADGLQAAHQKGILHRDVKPANILVTQSGSEWQVKWIDFGLALKQKIISDNDTAPRQFQTIIGKAIAGTVDYAAPEQMGRRHDAVGPYSDIYGFAKTCCYALFETAQPLPKHWQTLPPRFAQLLEKCLDEDPKKRPQSFAEVLSCLDALPEVRCTPQPAPARVAALATAVAHSRPWWKKLLPLAAALGLILVVVLAALVSQLGKQAPPGADKPDIAKQKNGNVEKTDPNPSSPAEESSALAGTTWVGFDGGLLEFRFQADGRVTKIDRRKDSTSGSYSQSGNDVTITFPGPLQYKGQITGKTMAGTATYFGSPRAGTRLGSWTWTVTRRGPIGGK